MKIGPYLNRAINSPTNMKFISVFIRVKASPLPGNGRGRYPISDPSRLATPPATGKMVG